MKIPRIKINGRIFQLTLVLLMAAMLMSGSTLFNSGDVTANHAILVEGEADFDGDGIVGGVDEDNDSTIDQVFGTINAALGSANAGANQNGRVVIVTSGRFLGMVNITAANGNVTLEGAPGVEANIEAVRAGAMGNPERQAVPGIIVNAPATRIVTIRNMVSRNWTDGIQINGASRVVIDKCRIENNTNFGIHVTGSSKVAINDTQVTASGFRSGAAPVNNAANPGVGIRFEGTSSGTVAFSMVAGSVAAGISNTTGNRAAVGILSVNVFDNMVDFEGIRVTRTTIPGVRGN
jgi:parallel beta-helix repeat protein